jgi:putative ABC transport system permease protein
VEEAMMPPRWNKVIADFFSNIVRSLLVIASIAVGLFAIGMIATIYQILSVDMRASYLSVNPANIRISASAFGQEMVDRVGHLDGVREASGAWRIGMRILSSPEQWSQLDLTALDFSENLPINRVELVDGKWPP